MLDPMKRNLIKWTEMEKGCEMIKIYCKDTELRIGRLRLETSHFRILLAENFENRVPLTTVRKARIGALELQVL